MWEGINHITKYRGNNQATARTDASLVEELNCFFACFEVGRPSADTPHPPPSSIDTLTLQEHDVRWVLRSVNPRKVDGPDGVPGKVLREYADQLTGVLTSHCPTMLRILHYHPHPQEDSSRQPQQLQGSCTHTYSHEVLRKTHLTTHQGLSASFS